MKPAATTLCLFLALAVFGQPDPPAPYGPTPSSRQLAWHELDYYAFIHFNINTFSDLEWGHGTESPGIFKPTELDCRHQPGAVIFSDAGPDIRWVGNERGIADPTNWCTLNRDDYYPGTPRYKELQSGNKNGTHWVPAEADVSIRPGWYYHADEDDKVKTADELEMIYYYSVGRNANLLLNLPVDRRGLVHENDIQALMELRGRLDSTFNNGFAAEARVKASNSRGKGFRPARLTDGYNNTYWTTKDEVKEATLRIKLGRAKTFNIIELREYLPLGQRIDSVVVEARLEGRWERVGVAATVGNRRFISIPRITAHKLRIQLQGMACPALSKIAVYLRPHDNPLLEANGKKIK